MVFGFRRGALLVASLALLVSSACDSRERPQSRSDASASPGGPVTDSSSRAAASSTADVPRIVVLGDSLTAGLGLSVDQAYPALLQRRLDDEGLKYQVINAGVSGDTSAGGLSRLSWALEGNVRILVV